MGTVNSAYIQFEQTMERCVEHWEMDGKVTLHNDYRNWAIGVLFIFQCQYLSIKDIINFTPTEERKVILDETVKHLREIKMQFYAYFNAIWC